MSWSVRVIAPEGMPEANEKIASFCKCSGNMYMCVMEMNAGKQLREMNRKEAMEALLEVIRELDKGNRGIFNDDYAVKADERWSSGEETRNAWKNLNGVESYAEYIGKVMRDRCRDDAVRFLLYYNAGYSIEYVW